MTDSEVLERLDRIEQSLSRIEDLLESNNNGNNNPYNTGLINKTLEIKETRQLMQDIVSYYKNTQPPINLKIGTKLQIFRFRDTLCTIKNIKNSKYERRRIIKYIRKLQEYQFIRQISADIFEVLDTGKDWSELK